jgi:hypothetical protein
VFNRKCGVILSAMLVAVALLLGAATLIADASPVSVGDSLCEGQVTIEGTDYSFPYVTATEWITPTTSIALAIEVWTITSSPNATAVWMFEVRNGEPWGHPIMIWWDLLGIGSDSIIIDANWGNIKPETPYWATFSNKQGEPDQEVLCYATVPVMFESFKIWLPAVFHP